MRYKDWKTVCLGQYLVDVPTELSLEYSWLFTFNLTRQKLEKVPGTPVDARKMAEDKARELRASPHDTKGSLYIQSLSLPNGGMLVQGWRFSFNTDVIDAFLYVPVTTQGKSFVYTYIQGRIYPDTIQKDVHDLIAFGSSFRPLKEGEIPKEPGLCLDEYAMLVNPPDSFTHDVDLNFQDNVAAGLYFTFNTGSATRKYTKLTEIPGWTEDTCSSLEGNGKCHHLRFGEHPVGPIQGEEICLNGKTADERYRIYYFRWDYIGVIDKTDGVMFILSYPGPPAFSNAPTPFFNDDEALAVWDRFVNSLRLRPVE